MSTGEKRDRRSHVGTVQISAAAERASAPRTEGLPTVRPDPEVVHCGRTAEVLAARQEVLTAAWQAHPDRFVRRPPTPTSPPVAVWINPPRSASEEASH